MSIFQPIPSPKTAFTTVIFLLQSNFYLLMEERISSKSEAVMKPLPSGSLA
jgi:hypothetical protein